MEDFPRIKRLPPYVFNIVNELKAEARQRGDDIIDFGMGNPDQPTPKHIVDKLCEVAQREGTHRYSMSRGIPRLRKAICNWYKRRYDVDLDMDSEAIVTIGSKEGLAHLALATVETGDVVLVPNPSYPIHPYGFVIAGADIRHVPLVQGGDFFEELQKAIKDSWPRPKIMVFNFPANPTTQCVNLEFFEKRYNTDTASFFAKYQRGETDDRDDYIDWAGEFQIFQSIQNQIGYLEELVLCK